MKYANDLKCLTLMVVAATSFNSFSQTTLSMPSQSDIEVQRNNIAKSLKSMDTGIAEKNQNKSQLNSYGGTTNEIKALPGVGGPVISKATQEDFMKLTRPDFQAKAAKPPAKRESDLLIFVSMSMPENMLMQYATQAKRFGAAMVLRGFVDDKLSLTRAAVQKLNASGAIWHINPQPFKTFKLEKVPAIVLTTADHTSLDKNECATPDSFTVIYGDMAIKDALDKMSILGQKKIAALAKSRILADRAAANKKG